MKKGMGRAGWYFGVMAAVWMALAGCGEAGNARDGVENVQGGEARQGTDGEGTEAEGRESGRTEAEGQKGGRTEAEGREGEKGEPERQEGGRGDTVTTDLTGDAKVENVDMEEAPGEKGAAAVMDFSVRLFGQCVKEGENMLISPFSVLCTLAMTANGAEGETLAQMEAVLGADREDWNNYLAYYAGHLPAGDGYKMNAANSIWLKDTDGLEVKPDFLQANGMYYDAGVFRAAFDKATVKDINGWVNGKTDGMIGDILDEIPEDAVMYLVNAVAFDAEWASAYTEENVWDGVFTGEDGTAGDVELMHSWEGTYLKDDNAQGFVKYYKGGKYAFAALLPDEGTGVAEYAKSLTGEKIMRILDNPEMVKVDAAIPKFEDRCKVEMGDILVEMGMADAFDRQRADFSGIGFYKGEKLYINRVLHETFIGVNEQGTKAGAATVGEIMAAGGAAPDRETKVVHLDRPFVYLVIDCGAGVPVFIGAVASVGEA